RCATLLIPLLLSVTLLNAINDMPIVAAFQGEHHGSFYGYSMVSLDFNHDGYDDVAIAASHEYAPQPSGNFHGYVWVYGGNAQLADTTVTNDDPMLPGIGDQLSIRLSPNPITRADQALSVNIKGSVTNGSEAVSIEIFNIKGQSVYRETHEHYSGAGKYMVNTPSLSTGIYLCKVISGKQTAISKFSVIK
ncbi:MAG: T9SS type A sorting domain-containing protein, partial [Candidatus Cloacimonetes bacterium]|nr:T9SS type A sorting domain-containing protein [Candidatus Cloacimonadota bacterium]